MKNGELTDKELAWEVSKAHRFCPQYWLDEEAELRQNRGLTTPLPAWQR